MGKRQRWPGDFFYVTGGNCCHEGSGGWMDGIGTSDDALGCCEEDVEGLGSIGWV